MTTAIRVTKLEAACRQLDAAIRLLFEQSDPVATHTLVGAASILLSDLIEHQDPARSWDRIAYEATRLTPGAYFSVMRNAQNFFKHARDDPAGVIDFDPTDTESLAFWAVMNASELSTLSVEMQVFQLWYIASHYPVDEPDAPPLKQAIELFGDLRSQGRLVRLKVGQQVLARELSQEPAA